MNFKNDETLAAVALAKAIKAGNKKDYVTPQRYGAIGDGITDDTLAFQQALASGNNIIVPSGTYKISAPLEMTRNQALQGENVDSTILLFDSCSGIICPDYQDRSGCTIENISIALTGTDTDTIGITLDTTNYSVIKNIRISGFKTGISLDHSVNNSFYDVFIITCGTGINIDNASYFNKAYNLIITTCGTGITGASGYLALYSPDIENNSVCDISGGISICAYNGNFEGYETTPICISLDTANAVYTFYNCTFHSYAKVFSASVETGKVSFYSCSFVNCTADFDGASFSYYFIYLPQFLTKLGAERAMVSNLNTNKGIIITSIANQTGVYDYSLNSNVSGNKGKFSEITIGANKVYPVKLAGRATVSAGTVLANSVKGVQVEVGTGIDAYLDQVIVSPNNVGLPSNILLTAQPTQSSTKKVTFLFANLSGNDISVGDISVNYKVI